MTDELRCLFYLCTLKRQNLNRPIPFRIHDNIFGGRRQALIVADCCNDCSFVVVIVVAAVVVVVVSRAAVRETYYNAAHVRPVVVSSKFFTHQPRPTQRAVAAVGRAVKTVRSWVVAWSSS